MITTTYNYTSGSGFIYDSSKIGFMGSANLLLQNNSGSFTQNYASSSGFTFNASNTEFVGGVMRQKNQAPATLAFYAAWDTFLNINYGTSTLGVTAFNSAAVAAGVLNLTGSTTKYVQLPSSYVIGNQATIAFVYTPNYSGNPSSNQIMYGNSGSANYFALLHSQSVGHLQLTVSNSAGTAIINAFNFGIWNPTSGTHYTIVLQFDIINGSTALYINGVQFGSTNNTTGTRTASVAAWVGSDGIPTDGNANFSIGSFALYSSVVGPNSLTPLPDYNFNADTISLPTFSYTGPGNILAWLSAAITDMNAPQYTIEGKYWTGSAWATSNLTFAQSNTAATIIANIATLPLANTINMHVYWQNVAQLQMSTALFTLNYTGQIYPTSNPSINPNNPLTMDQLSAFIDVQSASGSDGIQFYLMISSQAYWWNGTAWVVSNQTYSQSNAAADIQTNAATLPISLGSYVTPYALLHSASGATTPSLTSLTLTYDYFGPEPTLPNSCLVFGYILDENELPLMGATLSATNPTTYINQGVVIAQGVRTATTDSIGYFSMNLIETSTLSGTNPVTFAVTYTQAQVGIGFTPVTYSLGSADIPNTPEANITSLTFL